MSEIPIEYEGYYLENVYGTNEFVPPQDENNEYIFRNKPLVVKEKKIIYDGKENVIEEKKIIYDGKEIVIDINFIEQRSQVFKKINYIWDEENKSITLETFYPGISIFDEKIFLIVSGFKSRLAASVKGLIPFVLYYYDIDNDKVLYCGFYAGELNEYGYYEGFSHVVPKSMEVRKK